MSFRRQRDVLSDLNPARIVGEVTRVVGLVAECQGLAAPVGAQCRILARSNRSSTIGGSSFSGSSISRRRRLAPFAVTVTVILRIGWRCLAFAQACCSAVDLGPKPSWK